jgi:anti-sigma regulatory factor (Ser/Thr protein kinase)
MPVLDELESLLLAEDLPNELVGEIRLVAEEGLSNIINYCGESAEEHCIEAILSLEGGVVCLELRDDGKPFNPLEFPPPDLDAPIDRRPNGGLGIHLIKELMDTISYAREGGRNVLVLKKKCL